LIEVLTLFDYINLWVHIYMNAGGNAAFLLKIVLGNLGLKVVEDGSIVLASF
jgi:hypothetical protein